MEINRRVLTGAEGHILHSIWGPHLWRIFPKTILVDAVLDQSHVDILVREFGFTPPTEPARFGTVGVFAAEPGADRAFIFAPRWAGIAVLAHEVGHAVAWSTYGSSVFDWSEVKNEAFALLADANATRWNVLEKEDRAQFACHIGLCRHHPLYRAALRKAWKLRRLPLKRQIEEMASGPD